MPIIQLSHIEKSYPPDTLLLDINFSVEMGEKIGLVGRNGCGKSTLFSILFGGEKEDGGTFFKKKGLSIGLLHQNPVISENDFSEMAYYYASRLLLDTEVFTRIPFLSGGEKTKLALSLLLAKEPDFLLLDEPTNHMDYESVLALSQLLQEFDGTALIISHDRYFLDETVQRILEISEGVIFDYDGNYSAYREQKAQRYQEQLHRYESAKKEEKRIDNIIKNTRDWAQKAHRESREIPSGTPKMGFKEKERVKAKKLDSRAKNTINRLERFKKKSEKRPAKEQAVSFTIASDVSSGKRIADVKNLSFSFTEEVLFEDSSFYLDRGDHVAVFGPNGCGKSTLIQLLCGEREPDSGEIWISPGRQAYVILQDMQDLENVDTDTLSYLTERIGVVGGTERALLHHLGITSKHLQTPVSSLSYGEKMKIRLSEPILLQTEFLILDEPTHYLDLPSREALEKTLKEYKGTLFLVSHDIYFLKEVCDKVLLFENQKFRRLECTFSEYLDVSKMED